MAFNMSRLRSGGAVCSESRCGRPTCEGRGPVLPCAGGGKAPPPNFTKYQMGGLLEGVKYDPANVEAGTMLYVSNCVFCHGVPGVDKGGNIKNLGYVPAETIANLKD